MTSRLRQSLARWANSNEQHDQHLREVHVGEQVLSIAKAPDREVVRLRGMLRSVTLRPRGGVPALEAELDDGSGRITLIWLGRRRIVGISPGRSVDVTGRIGVQDGIRIMYNPRYSLMP